MISLRLLIALPFSAVISQRSFLSGVPCHVWIKICPLRLRILKSRFELVIKTPAAAAYLKYSLLPYLITIFTQSNFHLGLLTVAVCKKPVL